jgi:GNAT superfamily N-acetyltransferase
MIAGLRQTYAQLGSANTAWYMLSRLLERISGGRWALFRYEFVAQYVADTPLEPLRGADIEIRHTVPQQALPEDYPRPAHAVHYRHAQGAQELTAWRGGHLAGFLWLIRGAYQEDEVRARYCLVHPHASWDFDVWVHPEERLGWVFRQLWEAARSDLRHEGIRWTCSRISAFNSASRRAHAQIGTVSMGAALFLRCGHWQWMLANVRPYFHLSRSAASYPQLNFDTSTLEQPCPTSNKFARF